MVILSIALAVTLGGIAVLLAMVVNLRARARSQDEQIRKLPKPKDGEDTKRQKEPAPSVITEHDDKMEIPAALVGERTLEQIKVIAAMLNSTPVNVLRSALVSGIWGQEPVFSPAEIAVLRRVITELPGIAAELGLDDEAPISGEFGGPGPSAS